MVPKIVPLLVGVNHGAAQGLPRIRAAVDVDDVPALGVLQVLAYLHAAPAKVADDVDIAVRVNLVEALDKFAHRNVRGALSMLGVPLVVLADVDKLGVLRYFLWRYVSHAPYPSHAEGLVLLLHSSRPWKSFKLCAVSVHKPLKEGQGFVDVLKEHLEVFLLTVVVAPFDEVARCSCF